MAEFYLSDKDGKLHFRAPAGGPGSHSVYDGIATDAEIKEHHGAYQAYLSKPRRRVEELKAELEAAEKHLEETDKTKAEAKAKAEKPEAKFLHHSDVMTFRPSKHPALVATTVPQTHAQIAADAASDTATA